MRVLIACEFSGIVREAFKNKGHDAWSCDILDTEIPGKHIKGNVLDVLYDGWDMMVAHPPCTYLANSGVRWLHEDITRWPKLFEGADFFNILYNSNIPKICVENPVMHKYGKQLVRFDQKQIVQPWMFGSNESKGIGLWLQGLPMLIPDNTVKPDNVEQRVWRMPPGKDRQKERSRFFPCVARAMADQWS